MNGIPYELQVALLARLKASLSVPVFDYVPQGTTLPYVTVGELTGVPFDSKTFDGLEPTVTIHAWSESKGKGEALKLLSQIEEAMKKENRLVLRENHSVSLQQAEFQNVFEETANVTAFSGDVRTYHGVIRFRFKIVKGVL